MSEVAAAIHSNERPAETSQTGHAMEKTHKESKECDGGFLTFWKVKFFRLSDDPISNVPCPPSESIVSPRDVFFMKK